MTEKNIAAVVLAAGKGTRMKSGLPKVLHPLAGRPMITHLLDIVSRLGATHAVVVVGAGADRVSAAVADMPGLNVTCVVQEPQLGTGHAVLAAREALAGFEGDVLVLYGDTPLVRIDTLEALVDARSVESPAPSIVVPTVVVLGSCPEDAAEYGRLVLDDEGALAAIREYKDASPEEREIDFCNSGMMAVDGAHLFALLDQVGNDNRNGEYYLTDIVEVARAQGLRCEAVEGDPDEMLGVNSRAQLAEAELIVQDRLREAALDSGVTMTDPATVYLAADTRFGQDVTIEPGVFFGPGVTIGDNVTIRAYSHLEGATVGDGASVGPFARLRPEAEVGAGARIGNFVEIKKSTLEPGAKVNHLTYIGDARVGANANVGAGTITCNYDGFLKYRTDIGAGAFIGSNTALVAPVTVGDGAIVGAGSVITGDVEADALAVTRAPQKGLTGWAARFRARKAKEKSAKRG
ncbi:MAG: bifunctional UDP-N-acetylglucosamine diphosphorylase/glucosamine-1-phosphate N-acetyltransferase GlmU [Rhodospirillales bacterium]|nr:bifunctional UDP-N-acetylglucosamine diphosphorylase/glucosamine-1-phosphate N-acetyltransferase GlmU [Rhodospirillales bacterium]